MKSGKITEPQCKRSVLKWLPKKQTSVIQGAGIGRDYSVIRTDASEYAVFSMATVTLPTSESENYAFWKAVNKLESSGAEPSALMASVFLPVRGGEDRISIIIRHLSDLCMGSGISYIGGHTELIEALRAPVITITVYGNPKYLKSNIPARRQPNRPGDPISLNQDIVVIGNIAMETTRMLLSDRYDELHSRYASLYLQGAKELCRDLSLHAVYTAIFESEIPVSYIHNLSTGGVYAGLWELGEACCCGMDVELKQIPILQETVEVCEYYDINPYMTFSGGSALLVTENSEDLILYLKKHDISAIKIGQMTTGNDRIVGSDDIHSYLTPPKGDDCYKVYGLS